MPDTTMYPAARLLATVCTIYDLTGSEITGGSRLASEARSMMAWIAKETAGCTLAEIVKATGRDPSSLSSAANRIEARARKEIQVRLLRDKIIELIA